MSLLLGRGLETAPQRGTGSQRGGFGRRGVDGPGENSASVVAGEQQVVRWLCGEAPHPALVAY